MDSTNTQAQAQLQALTTWTPQKLKALEHTAAIVQKLQSQVSVNSEGEPFGYIDCSVVQSEYSAEDPHQIDLRDAPDALQPLFHQDGYPGTTGGLPFWERLENEPLEYYNIFKAYREDTYIKALTEQAYEKSQALQKESEGRSVLNPHSRRAARSLYSVADRMGVDRVTLRTLSQLYHWHLRAKAYDQFNERQLSIIKDAELQHMHNTHLTAARKIFDKCMDFLDNPDNLKELNPKTALEWFQTAVELERLSLGLPKDKPPEDGQGGGSDRRPWVQINQQYNQNTLNQTGTGTGTGAGSQGGSPGGSDGDHQSTSGTGERGRVYEILRTLNEAQVIDVVIEDVFTDD